MRFVLVLLLAATSAYGQQFKKLKVGFGFGTGLDWPNDNGSKSRATIVYLEPSWRINDRIAVGVRLENGTSGGIIRTTGSANSFIASYGVNGQYYLSNKNFRLFTGFGMGFYHPGLTGGYPYSNSSREEATRFGFYPRIGFDYGHFSFTVDYNVVPSSSAMIYDSNTNSSASGQLANSYGSVKLGVLIGGGRK